MTYCIPSSTWTVTVLDEEDNNMKGPVGATLERLTNSRLKSRLLSFIITKYNVAQAVPPTPSPLGKVTSRGNGSV